MKWEAGIPGKAGTAWENGLFKINLFFPEGTLPPSPFPLSIALLDQLLSLLSPFSPSFNNPHPARRLLVGTFTRFLVPAVR